MFGCGGNLKNLVMLYTKKKLWHNNDTKKENLSTFFFNKLEKLRWKKIKKVKIYLTKFHTECSFLDTSGPRGHCEPNYRIIFNIRFVSFNLSFSDTKNNYKFQIICTL